MRLRTVATEETRKIPVGLSFAGVNGYKAHTILEESKKEGYSKSGLVVDLLLVFGEAKKLYGDNAIHMLMYFATQGETVNNKDLGRE